jgi:hypothetical protein
LAAAQMSAASTRSNASKNFNAHLVRGELREAEAALKSSPKDHLSWGRLRYQKGDFAGAVKSYEAIPRSSGDFIKSREELGWAYLRQGDLGALRGLLTHLNSELVPLENRLEGRVLSAITYLKQCQYDGVKAELQEFQKELLPLAKTVESDPKKTRLKSLVAEAVLKMRYVKLELLSQVQWLEKLKSKPDVLAKHNDTVNLDDEQTKKIAQVSRAKQVFPVNKDVWVDELFKVRALSNTECESLQRGKL